MQQAGVQRILSDRWTRPANIARIEDLQMQRCGWHILVGSQQLSRVAWQVDVELVAFSDRVGSGQGKDPRRYAERLQRHRPLGKGLVEISIGTRIGHRTTFVVDPQMGDNAGHPDVRAEVERLRDLHRARPLGGNHHRWMNLGPILMSTLIDPVAQQHFVWVAFTARGFPGRDQDPRDGSRSRYESAPGYGIPWPCT